MHHTHAPSHTSHAWIFVAGLALVLAAYGQPQTHPAEASSFAEAAVHKTAPAYHLDQPVIEAASAILVDNQTGDILFELNADEVREPASTTKIMTAILALEHGKKGSLVEVSEAATLTGGSRLLISEGELIPLDDMIEATMIRSGNDGAHALAETVSGSEARFLELMNFTAAELGMANTHFNNPHGMPMRGGGNKSTAHDLAILGRFAMQNPEFRKIVQESEVTYPVFGNRTEVEYSSTNKLLGEFPLCTGIKTGYTNAARHCLVSSARFRDREVLAVILGAEKSTIRRDMVRLFDFGLNQLSDEYWIYRKFALEPTVYPFAEEPVPGDTTQLLTDLSSGIKM